MATMSITATLKPKIAPSSNPKQPIKLISLISLQNLPKTILNTKSLSSTAIAGAIFSSLSYSNPAMAAQQIADIAEGDNRGLALLLPIVPAILWVLYNILQPALNQINRMINSDKGFIVGLGLGAGLSAGYFSVPSAEASEMMKLAEAAGEGSDNRGLLLLFVVAPALGWVLYNILQPALNQINRMRSG